MFYDPINMLQKYKQTTKKSYIPDNHFTRFLGLMLSLIRIAYNIMHGSFLSFYTDNIE